MDLSDILKTEEGQFFDRKSAKIDPKHLAGCAMSFANADGGQIIVGVEDNGKVTGFKDCPSRESEIREILPSYVKPPLRLTISKISYEDERGVDFVLLISIEPSSEMHENQLGEVTLRSGRQTRHLKYDEIQHLQYDKGLQRFESKKADRASLGDLANDLILALGAKLGLSDPERILIARDLLTKKDGGSEINFAGILLFGSHPQSWIERARIRVIKYQGIGEATGVNLNIVKDLFFEGSLINQLDESARAIESLLREFTKLDPKTGKFITVPEYPPSAWREMLVNAIAHREYALTGVDIQIKIFDDRLEVISPGNFPSTVREDNIRDTHFSRNPKIARVLGDLGYVRELGEGVNRIFDEMAAANLPNPIFKNPSGSVVVTLKNDIAKRELRKHADLLRQIPKELFDSLEEEERIIVFYVLENGKITKKDATTLIKRSTSTVLGILKRLQQKSPPILITVRSSPQDPNAHYILNPEIAPVSPQPPATSKSIQGNLFWPKKD